MTYLRFLFRILACFLRPPWGMMLLATGFVLFSFVFFGKKSWDEFHSQSLLFQLEKSKDNQKEVIAQNLPKSDAIGIRLLIRGLSAKDEATAQTCHQTLKGELFQWQSLSNDEASKNYLIFSKELAEISKSGTLYSQQLALELALIVQKDIINRGFENQRLVSQNCQKVIDSWQAGQRDPSAVTGFSHHISFDTTLAGAGEPLNARVAGINVPYLVAQPINSTSDDRLQQLADYQNDKSIGLPKNDFSLHDDQTSQQSKSATSPRVGFYSLYSPESGPMRPLKNDQVLIASDRPKNVSPFLHGRLQQVASQDLSKLPTQDLMKLLNHTNRAISVQSEALLKKRDGFQDEHIQLARKLYHTEVSVRKLLLSQLSDNEQLEMFSWLSELLKDPDQDVRMATAKAIYSQIPLDEDELVRLKKIMQSDTDQRIAALGQGLETRVSSGGSLQRNYH